MTFDRPDATPATVYIDGCRVEVMWRSRGPRVERGPRQVLATIEEQWTNRSDQEAVAAARRILTTMPAGVPVFYQDYRGRLYELINFTSENFEAIPLTADDPDWSDSLLREHGISLYDAKLTIEVFGLMDDESVRNTRSRLAPIVVYGCLEQRP